MDSCTENIHSDVVSDRFWCIPSLSPKRNKREKAEGNVVMNNFYLFLQISFSMCSSVFSALEGWPCKDMNVSLLSGPWLGLASGELLAGDWMDSAEWCHGIYCFGSLSKVNPCPCSSQEDLLYTTFSFCRVLEVFSSLILFGPHIVRVTHLGHYSIRFGSPVCQPYIIINPFEQLSLSELPKFKCATIFCWGPDQYLSLV